MLLSRALGVTSGGVLPQVERLEGVEGSPLLYGITRNTKNRLNIVDCELTGCYGVCG
jgi:hypothetical protein